MKKNDKLLFYILLAPVLIITILFLNTQRGRIEDQNEIKGLKLEIEKLEKANRKLKKQFKSPKYTPENNALRELMRWEG